MSKKTKPFIEEIQNGESASSVREKLNQAIDRVNQTPLDAPKDGKVYGRKDGEWAEVNGAAGPQGPTGATGPQGPTGAEGPNAIGGFSIQLEANFNVDDNEDDLLIFENGVWTNISKEKLTDGGTF